MMRSIALLFGILLSGVRGGEEEEDIIDAEIEAFVARATSDAHRLYDTLFVEEEEEEEDRGDAVAEDRQSFVERFVTRRLHEGTAEILQAKGVAPPPNPAGEQQRERVEQCYVEEAEEESLPGRRRRRRTLPSGTFEEVSCLRPLGGVEVPGCAPPVRCGRLLQHEVATAAETAFLRGEIDRAMRGLYHNGGSTSLAVSADTAAKFAPSAWSLVRELALRAQKIAEKKALSRLYRAGGLLTRLDAEPRLGDRQVNASHVYWNPHVDKANRLAYDYSALLYLSDGGGRDFEGGDLVFYDDDQSKTVVEPAAGSLVVFTSGLENLHAVSRVLRGHRFVFALWFTCEASLAYADDYLGNASS